MTTEARTGFENAWMGLLLTLSDGMPAKIAAYNAAIGCSITAQLAGSYVFATDATLIDDVNKAGAVTVTIPAGTYTAAELAAQLNGDADFTDQGIEATTRLVDFLVVQMAVKGGSDMITVGDGSANATLGIVNGQKYKSTPLQDIALYRVRDVEDYDDAMAYPSCLIGPEGQEVVSDDGQENEYRLIVRFLTSSIVYTAGASHTAYRQALQFGQFAKELIHESTNFHQSVDGKHVESITPGASVGENKKIRGLCDVSVIVHVEED